MEPNKDLEFSLTREEKPVTIGGQQYVLVELDGTERDKYLTGLGNRLKHGPDGKPAGLKNFDGLQASLITACLRSTEVDGRKPVLMATIQSWPARVVNGLYEAARDLNGLGEEDDAKKGNE